MHSSSPSDNYRWQLKIKIVGDNGVGKANLMNAMTRLNPEAKAEPFSSFYTLDDYFSVSFNYPVDNIPVRFFMTSYRYQGRFRSMGDDQIYGGGHAIVLVYDMTDLESFNNVATTHLRNADRFSPPEHCLHILVGTKADLVNKRAVDYETAQGFAEQHNMLFLEVSAKTDLNIKKLTETIARKILEENLKQQQKQLAEQKKQALSNNLQSLESVMGLICSEENLAQRNEIVKAWLEAGNNLNHDRWSSVRKDSLALLFNEVKAESDTRVQLGILEKALTWPLFNVGRGTFSFGRTDAVKAIQAEIDRIKPFAEVAETRARYTSGMYKPGDHKQEQPVGGSKVPRKITPPKSP